MGTFPQYSEVPAVWVSLFNCEAGGRTEVKLGYMSNRHGPGLSALDDQTDT